MLNTHRPLRHFMEAGAQPGILHLEMGKTKVVEGGAHTPERLHLSRFLIRHSITFHSSITGNIVSDTQP